MRLLLGCSKILLLAIFFFLISFPRKTTGRDHQGEAERVCFNTGISVEPLIEECYLIYFHADNIHYRELDFALGRILELKGDWNWQWLIASLLWIRNEWKKFPENSAFQNVL